ncbi:hypothetical protein [Virgibacillus senegalensis]|uniref:hypothetical protein n=1 Tax=Virgibacillus senegalensis TaxID=1499679 RepID=UPI00069EE476|nr:hypothetical protein [Virgibacillus senegalensis]
MKKMKFLFTFAIVLVSLMGFSTIETNAAPTANASISTFDAGGDTGVRGSGGFNGGRADEVDKVYYRFQLYRNGIGKGSKSGYSDSSTYSASITNYEYSNTAALWKMVSFGTAYYNYGGNDSDQESVEKYVRAYH